MLHCDFTMCTAVPRLCKLVYPYFWCYVNLVPRASFPLTSGRKTRALVFRPLVKGNEALGTRLMLRAKKVKLCFLDGLSLDYDEIAKLSVHSHHLLQLVFCISILTTWPLLYTCITYSTFVSYSDWNDPMPMKSTPVISEFILYSPGGC